MIHTWPAKAQKYVIGSSTSRGGTAIVSINTSACKERDADMHPKWKCGSTTHEFVTYRMFYVETRTGSSFDIRSEWYTHLKVCSVLVGTRQVRWTG